MSDATTIARILDLGCAIVDAPHGEYLVLMISVDGDQPGLVFASLIHGVDDCAIATSDGHDAASALADLQRDLETKVAARIDAMTRAVRGQP